MDLVGRGTRIPEEGETVIGSDFRMVPGGKGANQAVAAARLGADVTMVGRLGDDDFADGLLQNLDTDEIRYDAVSKAPDEHTGVALIMVAETGENSILVAPGANMTLSPQHLAVAETAFEGADVLLLQLEVPVATVTRAAELAYAHDVKVVLNPAPAQELPDELLGLVYALVPNESETAVLTGMSVSSRSEAEDAARALLHLGVEVSVLTLGRRGALLAAQDGVWHVAPFEVETTDTTAAGDAFIGGFAVALAEGKSLEEAVRWGNAAGALATTKVGAQTSLPHREDVEKLLGI
jgi:ribokinase